MVHFFSPISRVGHDGIGKAFYAQHIREKPSNRDPMKIKLRTHLIGMVDDDVDDDKSGGGW